ncbi:MAG TPA: NUDIX domain-containing protein [Ktedonobacterales bacterium]|nr:NUDIX domain-containing protein [Ktedonobacterales bacterium]
MSELESLPLQRRLACVLLVDRAGRILMQLRDGTAWVSPNQWTMPGGGIEEGEDAETAARRELLEETGLAVDGPLELFWSGLRPSSSHPGLLATHWHVYCARTDARQEDVVLGEGVAMLFKTSEEIAGLDLAMSAAFFLPLFLASAQYRRLAGASASPEPA